MLGRMAQETEAERYLAMAKDAHAVADRMKDSSAQSTMRQIAQGYEHLAMSLRKRAERTER